MKNIQAIKIGNIINISINGKLHKKNCSSPKEADEFFKIILKAKENPTDENIKKINLFLNERTRIAIKAGLEADSETGEVFLAGFNTNIPDALVEIIKEYTEMDYPLTAIINFWKLLMINPDKRIRTSLFNFIKVHDFVLTDSGYMIVYKRVDYFNDNNQSNENKIFTEFISKQYLHVKKDWQCNPNKYAVYKKLNADQSKGDEVFGITKVDTAEIWDVENKNVEILGKLGDIFNDIFNSYNVNDKKSIINVPIYTDTYSHSFKIQLGIPVKQKRKECDADPDIDCSNGLHVGATKYVENFSGKVVLVCFVNPANVVAVPKYDHSKMRVCEYFPFALATFENGKIDFIKESFFESDYKNYEEKELQKMIDKVKKEELPIEKAINAEEEQRNMSELLKILETRLFELDNDIDTKNGVNKK